METALAAGNKEPITTSYYLDITTPAFWKGLDKAGRGDGVVVEAVEMAGNYQTRLNEFDQVHRIHRPEIVVALIDRKQHCIGSQALYRIITVDYITNIIASITDIVDSHAGKIEDIA